MIIATHTLIYSDDAAATRAFLRDVLGFGFVSDGGEGDAEWLIFGTGPSELGVHPTRSEHGGQIYESPRQHQISFMVDDLAQTRLELEARGAVFTTGIDDRGFGLTSMIAVPGADDIMLYEARHQTAYDNR